jgi:hypothetical protein
MRRRRRRLPGLAEPVEARPTENLLDGPSSTSSDRPDLFSDVG